MVEMVPGHEGGANGDAEGPKPLAFDSADADRLPDVAATASQFVVAWCRMRRQDGLDICIRIEDIDAPS